ncbi:MAG: hypothetical protein PX483_13380 [Nostocales cyanobacterium LE14-WE4]|uniref:hypothetical protein n=1 Tax=Dolichospermum sp. UHCC 0315A TaxID=1914871 RepID=UPI001AEFE36D|nr:hypothetical protein [Dolichospermum sp. UHCC 0315A]MBS9392591.1 hypothetical protein [Dolichospermum sp. OL01]MCE2698639.1 hypothetical protein [Anabaena sp. 49633_E8]MCO5796230.1 hypothetical protein [Dolichospermum sp. OL03]MCS6281567.1 hypothetical protein [Dolichospermum sp.]MDJ0501824.1 hypothetical protein [Nostocales cyanobacterium LE14-WE4]
MKANCRINPALTFCIYCIINDLQKSRGEAFAYKNYATNRQLNSANASPVRQRIEHAKKIARNVCRSNVNVTVMICLGVETA